MSPSDSRDYPLLALFIKIIDVNKYDRHGVILLGIESAPLSEDEISNAIGRVKPFPV